MRDTEGAAENSRARVNDDEAVQQLRADVIAHKNLPTIPAVLARILQLVESENGSGRELIEVIEHDQVLTAKLLRLANSAFFGQSRRVATVPRAVVLLGYSTVRNLSLGVKIWDTLGRGIARARLEELWMHAVVVALAVKTVAAKLRAGNPDEAFTAGILHDIGRLVLAARFQQEYWRALGDAGCGDALDAVERASFGVDHAEVGGWVLEAWSLPPSIVEAVRLHHGSGARAGLPGLLAVVNRLVAWTDFARGTMRGEPEAFMEAAKARGITAALWVEVVDRLRDGGELAALGRLEA
jgi:putative nucleotidyltransferase with HDIG domain